MLFEATLLQELTIDRETLRTSSDNVAFVETPRATMATINRFKNIGAPIVIRLVRINKSVRNGAGFDGSRSVRLLRWAGVK